MDYKILAMKGTYMDYKISAKEGTTSTIKYQPNTWTIKGTHQDGGVPRYDYEDHVGRTPSAPCASIRYQDSLPMHCHPPQLEGGHAPG